MDGVRPEKLIVSEKVRWACHTIRKYPPVSYNGVAPVSYRGGNYNLGRPSVSVSHHRVYYVLRGRCGLPLLLRKELPMIALLPPTLPNAAAYLEKIPPIKHYNTECFEKYLRLRTTVWSVATLFSDHGYSFMHTRYQVQPYGGLQEAQVITQKCVGRHTHTCDRQPSGGTHVIIKDESRPVSCRIACLWHSLPYSPIAYRALLVLPLSFPPNASSLSRCLSARLRALPARGQKFRAVSW